MENYRKLIVFAVVALVIGVGAILALGWPTPDVEADSVAVLKTAGMTCGSCAGKIEKALGGKPGVAKVAVNVESGQVLVAYDSKAAKADNLADTVTGTGFGSSVIHNLSMEQYQTLTGRAVLASAETKSGGCGGGCCNRN